MRYLRLPILALLLAACAGPDADAGAGPQDGAPAGSAQPEAATPPAAPRVQLPPGREPAAPAVERAPTQADSAAAAQQDVSPEWIQRSRTMESYDSCMAKAASVEEPVRVRLQEACGRLPDAP